jgi:hypothetical protein
MTMRNIIPVLLASITIFGCHATPPSKASAQIGQWIATGEDRFTLSQIQDLPPWTALHVFAPYTPTTIIEQHLGFEWQDASRLNLDARDDIHLAVFVLETTVAHVEEWERTRFDCGPDLTGHVLSPSATIRIDRTKDLPTLTTYDAALGSH